MRQHGPSFVLFMLDTERTSRPLPERRRFDRRFHLASCGRSNRFRQAQRRVLLQQLQPQVLVLQLAVDRLDQVRQAVDRLDLPLKVVARLDLQPSRELVLRSSSCLVRLVP